MKRTIVAVLVATALIPSPATAAERPSGPCTGFQWRAPDAPKEIRLIVIQEVVSDLITCVERRWPVPGGIQKALEIAWRESNLLWFAANPSREACNSGWGSCGVYQHLGRYWPSRVKQYLRPEWFPKTWPDVPWSNARANVIVAIRMAHSGGWCPWTPPGYCG